MILYFKRWIGSYRIKNIGSGQSSYLIYKKKLERKLKFSRDAFFESAIQVSWKNNSVFIRLGHCAVIRGQISLDTV